MTAPLRRQRCRSCNAGVAWVKTTTGSSMPIDFDPRPDGNITLEGDVATVLGPLELEALPDDAERYVSHFVTCPDSKSWRKGSRR